MTELDEWTLAEVVATIFLGKPGEIDSCSLFDYSEDLPEDETEPPRYSRSVAKIYGVERVVDGAETKNVEYIVLFIQDPEQETETKTVVCVDSFSRVVQKVWEKKVSPEVCYDRRVRLDGDTLRRQTNIRDLAFDDDAAIALYRKGPKLFEEVAMDLGIGQLVGMDVTARDYAA